MALEELGNADSLLVVVCLGDEPVAHAVAPWQRLSVVAQDVDAGDIAVVEGVWELSGLRGPDGKERPPVKGLSLAVCVNKGREWLLAAGQTMLPVPASPAAPVI